MYALSMYTSYLCMGSISLSVYALCVCVLCMYAVCGICSIYLCMVYALYVCMLCVVYTIPLCV